MTDKKFIAIRKYNTPIPRIYTSSNFTTKKCRTIKITRIIRKNIKPIASYFSVSI